MDATIENKARQSAIPGRPLHSETVLGHVSALSWPISVVFVNDTAHPRRPELFTDPTCLIITPPPLIKAFFLLLDTVRDRAECLSCSVDRGHTSQQARISDVRASRVINGECTRSSFLRFHFCAKIDNCINPR